MKKENQLLQTELNTIKNSNATDVDELQEVSEIITNQNGNINGPNIEKRPENISENLEDSKPESLILPESSTISSIPEPVKKLEQRFKDTMERVAELTDEKQRLEHLVLQLQGETETIGILIIYNLLYCLKKI